MKPILFLASLAALATASSADAALLKFTINGAYDLHGPYSATFFLDSSPAVDPSAVFDDYAFYLTGVAFADAPSGFAAIQFFNDDPVNGGGGLIIFDNDDFSILFDATDGKQYYTGPEASPTFLPGLYTNLQGLGNSLDRGTFSLEISAVPEPASWAMMIGGFALAGSAMRRQRRRVSVSFRAA